MSTDTAHADHVPIWSVIPDETDWLAWSAIIAIGLAVYLIMFLYARFDRWAEHKAEGTVLAKTIPTLLAMALLYEIFPLDHFSILLPLTAILIAVMSDWMTVQARHEPVAVDQVITESIDPEPEREISTAEQTKHKPAAFVQPRAVKTELDPEKKTNV